MIVMQAHFSSMTGYRMLVEHYKQQLNTREVYLKLNSIPTMVTNTNLYFTRRMSTFLFFRF